MEIYSSIITVLSQSTRIPESGQRSILSLRYADFKEYGLIQKVRKIVQSAMSWSCMLAKRVSMIGNDRSLRGYTWGVQVLRYPNFFSGMEADRNVKVVGGEVAIL